jgi:hypothetical protein
VPAALCSLYEREDHCVTPSRLKGISTLPSGPVAFGSPTPIHELPLWYCSSNVRPSCAGSIPPDAVAVMAVQSLTEQSRWMLNVTSGVGVIVSTSVRLPVVATANTFRVPVTSKSWKYALPDELVRSVPRVDHTPGEVSSYNVTSNVPDGKFARK